MGAGADVNTSQMIVGPSGIVTGGVRTGECNEVGDGVMAKSPA